MAYICGREEFTSSIFADVSVLILAIVALNIIRGPIFGYCEIRATPTTHTGAISSSVTPLTCQVYRITYRNHSQVAA
jgi:hypothetical protein